MRPGETIATYDVGLALRGKSGKFEVISPAGETYDVTCKPNHSVSALAWSNNGTEHPPFVIRKVAEGASQTETKVTAAGMLEPETEAAPSRLPFVLERGENDAPSSNAGNIDLLYLEDDPRTGQTSACVYLKSECRGHANEAATLLTSRCATFNELDAEIRRLEAQLDEIRSRGKRMFYKAQAVAASA